MKDGSAARTLAHSIDPVCKVHVIWICWTRLYACIPERIKSSNIFYYFRRQYTFFSSTATTPCISGTTHRPFGTAFQTCLPSRDGNHSPYFICMKHFQPKIVVANLGTAVLYPSSFIIRNCSKFLALSNKEVLLKRQLTVSDREPQTPKGFQMAMHRGCLW